MTERSAESVDRLKWVRRISRIMSALILGITLMMLVAHIIVPEPHEADYPPVENLLPVIMCLSVLGLGIAWRWEGVGGAISIFFFLVHLAMYWVIRQKFFPLQVLMVFSPVPITAILFLVCWWKSRVTQEPA